METKTDLTFIRRLGQVSDHGVTLYDLKLKKFSYFNKNFLEIFGITAKEIESDPFIIVQRIIPEDLGHIKSSYQDLLVVGHASNIEFTIRVNELPLKRLICDIFILEENPFILATVKDITKQKSHEDFVINYSAQKDTLLDMLTHNLSGPLHLSKDLLHSLETGAIDTKNIANVQKTLSFLKDNNQTCIDIVNDFLKEEHNQSMRTYVRKTRFDVITKINITLDRLIQMNPSKTFTVHSSPRSLLVNSDAVKFFQVFHNLVSNAIKFTGKDGKIEIIVTQKEKTFTVCVRDNGIGIPDSLKEILFSERISSRPGVEGEKSSGLGLSIAQKLVNVMGGQITFESQEGQGSSFYIHLTKE